MLADFPIGASQCGRLSSDLHRPAAFLHELLDFIADELPRWRDDRDRPEATSETALTEHLCDYLGGATRKSSGWDVLQFRTEVADEESKGRKIDLAAKPRGTTIWIEGRRYAQYDSLLPIECKRLPTPGEKDRDEREYVFSQYASTGGIQRFKAGHHGAAHSLGAMIGYLQADKPATWSSRVSEWIRALAGAGQSGWSESDCLQVLVENTSSRLMVLRSAHDRAGNLSKIELRHFWIQMN
jgi:hypothetical protein